MSKFNEDQIWKDYINCYTLKNYTHLTDFMDILIGLKYYTTEYEERLKSSARSKIRKEIKFDLPHTASYNYILRFVDNPQLFKIINDSLIKIEKKNKFLRGKIKTIDFNMLGISIDLLSRVLLELNALERDEMNELRNTLKEDLLNRFESEMKEFEKNKKIVFKGDLPISIKNWKIFDNTFIVEQWMRRLLLFILMTKYGSRWLDSFTNKDIKEYEDSRNRLIKREILEFKDDILEFKDDNIIWYTTIFFLSEFIKKKEIIEMVEDLTGKNGNDLSSSLNDIKEVRNEMAHNRTITIDLERKFEERFKTVSDAITMFKTRTLYYDKGDILSDFIIKSEKNPIIMNFNKEYQKTWNEHKLQAFIKDAKYCYNLVLLPCVAIKHNFIDIQTLLSSFKEFNNHIIAFYVNKLGGEYQLLIPKDINNEKYIYENIIDIFFSIPSNLGSDIPYELQDSRYTCNPKIWFYENDYEQGVNNLFDNGEII